MNLTLDAQSFQLGQKSRTSRRKINIFEDDIRSDSEMQMSSISHAYSKFGRNVSFENHGIKNSKQINNKIVELKIKKMVSKIKQRNQNLSSSTRNLNG